MRYWWVNHKQTSQQELQGGYLWSPVVERDGKFSQYYYNMRLARIGDGVVSYAHGALGAIGTVADGAMLAPRPAEFGSVGASWADIGWLLPVQWLHIPPLRPKEYLQEFAPLLPAKYSPIRAQSGNGNQKAYLSEVSAELFGWIQSRAGAQAPRLDPERSGPQSLLDALEDATEQSIAMDPALSATEREQLCKARKGQGLFRKNVLSLQQSCRLTGIRSPSILIASHIKPWRSCSTAVERLDGNNGLLLAPHADFLFDRGYISFSQRGELLVSPVLIDDIRQRLHLPTRHSTDFAPAQLEYMKYHREYLFQS